MSYRQSNVEKHGSHGEDQCSSRRSTRSESALSLKHSRGCCAPYQLQRSRNERRHQVLSSNALIASSPNSSSESAWLRYSCKSSATATSPSFSKPCGKRDLTVNGSIVDMTQRRQLFGSGAAGDSTTRLSTSILSDFALRLLPARLRENEFNFEETKINKIFASHWLNERQVVMGTKCNKLLVFDVVSHQVSYIPMLKSSGRYHTADPPCGIHAIGINPSSTMLATGGHSTNDIAIYSLPTFDPVAVCENGHEDWVFGIDWIDDEFLVSGSRDSNICLYRVNAEQIKKQSVNRSGQSSKCSPPLASSSGADSKHYRYSSSRAHTWMTVTTRSSASNRRTADTHITVYADDDDDDEAEADNELLLANGRRLVLDPPHFEHSSSDEEDEGDEVDDGDVEEAEGDNDVQDEDEERDDGEHDHGDDVLIDSSHPNNHLIFSSSWPHPRSFRRILHPVRRQPRAIDLWDMDEIEDEQNTDGVTSTPTKASLPAHPCLTPLSTIKCDRAEKIRAVAYNKWLKQVATLSLNAYFNLIDVNTFSCVEEPLRLPHPRENVCMNVNEDGSLFAIGSQSNVTFVDPRIMKLSGTRSIFCKQRGCGIRSLSFKNDVLTIGTGQGSVYFYDVRADKYLELFCGTTVQLEAGMGWLNHDDTYHDFFVGHEYPNAIYTHCYDPAGTRLFTAGGPLPAGLYGNYAALWY